ncbi:MAG TPA: histidine kinase [Candidatus Limnocylindrales bacterium]|nr:histidine kinase [Candidatus Limnocylindrales bacterium]
MTASADLAAQLAAESANLDAEIREIDMLVNQARSESARHETRRASAVEKLAAMGSSTSAREAIDLATQTVTLTRRAALMDAQVEILEAKKKALLRLQESVDDHAKRVLAIGGVAASGLGEAAAPGDGGEDGNDDAAAEASPAEAAPGGKRRKGGRTAGDAATGTTPAMSRIILTAQEDLRREIARAMHDGPAQSLTNIVLQAEIVERLVGVDQAAAEAEVRQLVAMVQSTLDATKAFIFDVRPMVLDDLGLVPTLRRAARERGRRAGVAVEFEALGSDRRLPVELESGLFRLLDEALAGYLAQRPDKASLRLDWGEVLTAELAAEKRAAEVPAVDLPAPGAKMPPALAEMMEQRRRDHDEAVEAAARAAIVQLPVALARDLADRAATLGISAEVLDDGCRLRLVAPLPESGDDARSGAGAGDGTGA